MQVSWCCVTVIDAEKFTPGFIIVVANCCRLTCFVVGQEEPSNSCRITGMKYPPALPAIYPKGVSHLSAYLWHQGYQSCRAFTNSTPRRNHGVLS